jgi:hypothetical protein
MLYFFPFGGQRHTEQPNYVNFNIHERTKKKQNTSEAKQFFEIIARLYIEIPSRLNFKRTTVWGVLK